MSNGEECSDKSVSCCVKCLLHVYSGLMLISVMLLVSPNDMNGLILLDILMKFSICAPTTLLLSQPCLCLSFLHSVFQSTFLQIHIFMFLLIMLSVVLIWLH